MAPSYPWFSLTLLTLAASVVAACSSDDSTGPATATAADAGDAAVVADAATPTDAATDAAVANDAATTTDGAPPATDAAADAAPPAGDACSFSVSGARTDPTTTATGCSNGYVKQADGTGQYLANVAATFRAADGTLLTVGCGIPSVPPPKAGDVWSLSKVAHGSCSLGALKGNTATGWEASSNDTTVVGAATYTFTSAAPTHGTNRPQDNYYTFDLTFDATMVADTAGTPDVTIHGHFQNSKLPLGS